MSLLKLTNLDLIYAINVLTVNIYQSLSSWVKRGRREALRHIWATFRHILIFSKSWQSIYPKSSRLALFFIFSCHGEVRRSRVYPGEAGFLIIFLYQRTYVDFSIWNLSCPRPWVRAEWSLSKDWVRFFKLLFLSLVSVVLSLFKLGLFFQPRISRIDKDLHLFTCH